MGNKESKQQRPAPPPKAPPTLKTKQEAQTNSNVLPSIAIEESPPDVPHIVVPNLATNTKSALSDVAESRQAKNAIRNENDLVVTVRPFEMEDEEQSIALPEPTMACLREQIVNAFEFPSDQTIRIYYTMPPTEVTRRKLLSPRAALGKILKRVENTESDVVFDYHSFVVVSVGNSQSSGLPTVLELSEFDINLLKSEIMKQFQLSNQDFTIHYVDSKTNNKVIVDKAEIFERACANSYNLVFELPIQTTNILSVTSSFRNTPPQDPKSRQQYDIFISYSWSTKAQVAAIVHELKTRMPHLTIWMDHNKMQGNIYSAMSGGISSSKVVIVCLSKGYLESANCNYEINFAADLKKRVIPVYLFEDGEDINELKQSYGVPFLITAGALYSDFKRYAVYSEEWSRAFDSLRKEVENAFGGQVSESDMGTSLMNVKSWLNPVDSSADIKAYESEYVRGTRMWVVEALNEWLDTGERAMWMNGGAGTGKSLIAYSLLVNLPASYSVGSIFFCRHNDERKRDPVALVSTIIWNLYTSVKNESFRLHIEAELKADHVRVKDENKQSILRDPVSAFESIVVEGLNKLPMQEQTLLIVIDALDELDILTRKSVLTILTSVCIKLPSFVKILTTGRPESDIYYSLNTLNPFILSPSAENNKEDLNIFIRSKVDAMWKRFKPSANADIEKCFNLLVEKSDGLFIYARNICEYLRQQYLTPSASLNVIEEFTMGPDGVYKAILDRAFKNDSTGEKCALFRNVFEVILGVQKPLGILSLVNIGNLTESQVETVVAEFRSILKIENGVVSVIHKSVKDYLSDPTRCNASYTIQPIDAVLATRCLEILCSNLHENMANLSPTLDYTPETLSSLNVFPEDVQYAIEYWPTHFHAAFTPSPSPTTPTQSTLLTTLQKFCTTTLPFYLESLLLLTSLPTLFTSITTHIKPRLPKTEQVSHTLLTDLLNTATNFRTQIVPSPLQVYRHALLAAPQDTLYARTYAHMVPARMVLGAEPSWGPREFHGHAGTVTSAVYTPDGSAIVSSAQEGGIRVWNGETGECWVTLCGHVRDVTGVKCGGGGVVVSGSLDRSVRVWDLGTGKCVRVWDVGADVFGVDVCGRVVVAGAKDKTVRVWDLEGGQEGMVLEGHLGSVRTVAVRWDGKLVVSGGHDHLVKVWSLETGECIHTFEGHGQLVREVVWSTDGTSIVSCSSDKTIKIWDLTSGVCVKTFDDTEGEVFSVALSQDGKIIASASGFQTDIKVWSVETGQVIKVLKGHLLPVWTVSFSIDDRCLVSGSRDRSVRVWNLNDTPLLEGNQDDSTEKQEHHCTIMAIAVSSKSKIVVAGDKEGYIKLWSTVTGHCVKTMKQDIMIRALCISPNEKFIAVGGYDGSVKLWDMESGLCIQEYEGHTKAILAVAFLADAKTVVSSSYDETVRVWSDGNCIDKVSISGDDYDSVFDRLKVVQSSGSTRFWIDSKGWIMLRKRDGTVDRLFDSHMWTTDASDDLLCWTIHAGQKVFALQADADMI